MSRRLAAFLVLLLPLSQVCAQGDLLGVDEVTVVQSISFLFGDTPRDLRLFTPRQLHDQIVTRSPGARDRLRMFLGESSLDAFYLDPIELQRDVVRLRKAFQDAGFLHARIGYDKSELDTTANRIDIKFTIQQGPPVIIQDVGFFSGAGYLAYAFEGTMRERWIAFRDETSFQTGDRFTFFEVVRIEDQVLGWLKDQGYAFPDLSTVVEVDSLYNVADISFLVDPGPNATIASITIEGQRQVSDQVILRALPFNVGDTFAQSKLFAAQRALFALNLFSVAQVTVPEQPRDSTVDILITTQQARLRHLSAEVGYHQRTGFVGQGTLSKRNFLGGGRLLSADADIESGLLAFAGYGAEVSRRLRTSLALGLPQLGFKWLNAVIEPFLQFEQDPLLEKSDEFLGLNRRSYGLNTNWYFGDPRRQSGSVRYQLSRETQYSAERADHAGVSRDAYDRSLLAFHGTLAWTDDFLRPTRGWVVRPALEQAGRLERWIGLPAFGLEYVKAELDVIGYIPLASRSHLTVRAGAGRIWPFGKQEVTFYTDNGPVAMDAAFAAPVENRFDAVRFYAGGANDVRGWNTGFAGVKINRTTAALDQSDTPVNEFFEPAGGLARLFASLEMQVPVKGPWQLAGFVDAGQVSSIESENCAVPLFKDPDLSIPVNLLFDYQCNVSDNGRLRWDQFRIGVGLGLRYDTPIGFIRLDLALKANPDSLDLQSPANAFRAAQGLEAAQPSQWRRFMVHFSIGQPL